MAVMEGTFLGGLMVIKDEPFAKSAVAARNQAGVAHGSLRAFCDNKS